MLLALTLILLGLSLVKLRSDGLLFTRKALLLVLLSLCLPISSWVLWIDSINRDRLNGELSMRLQPGAEDLPGIGSTGALAHIFPPASIPKLHDPDRNDGIVVVAGNRVEHWINGVLVSRYQLNGSDLEQAPFVHDNPWLVGKRSGPILLEHSRHGMAPIWFCNIKIRNLNPYQLAE
jgi:hypothetical protein